MLSGDSMNMDFLGPKNNEKLNFGINGEKLDEHLVQLPFLFRNIRPPAKVLDIGSCGSPAALQLAMLRYNVTGIDFSEYARRHQNLRSLTGDFNSYDFKKDRFDIVIAMNTIEYMGLQHYKKDELLDKQADVRAMTKAKELINRGGQLIFSAKYGIPDTITLSGKPFMKVYDDKALDVLLSTFHIDTIEYYMVADRKNVRQVPREEAAASRYYHSSGTYGFVCVSATKL
jgi:hypothetical protein